MRHSVALSLLAILLMPILNGAELRVPAATAYLDPGSGGARVSRRNITRWTNPEQKIVWYGQLNQTGTLDVSLVLRLKAGMTSKLKLTVAGQSREVVAEGRDDETVKMGFGNEGTGGHSHLKFKWKTGERQRFLVTAEPVNATHTVFAGYYFRPQRSCSAKSSLRQPMDSNDRG